MIGSSLLKRVSAASNELLPASLRPTTATTRSDKLIDVFVSNRRKPCTVNLRSCMLPTPRRFNYTPVTASRGVVPTSPGAPG